MAHTTRAKLVHTTFLENLLGGWHFLWKGFPNLQEVGIDKTTAPLFQQQKFYDPHH